MIEEKDNIIDFTTIFKRIIYLYGLLIKYYKLAFVYILSAIILAIILRFTLPAFYSGSFIIKSNENKDPYYINMLLDLETLVSDKDYSGIANELKIPESEATLIKKISMLPISKGKSGDTGVVIITLRMSEQNKFIQIQNSLISYLENNSNYQKLKENRLSKIASLENKITRDIIEMDSVKRIIIDNIKPVSSSGSGVVYNVPVDPYKAYDINMDRYKEQLWLIEQQKLSSSFELMKPCVVSKKPVWPKLSILTLVLVPLFLLVFVFHAHRRENINLSK
ncbi:MAG: hypothetical protein K9H41_05760 [Bacteroidia bacterium]|nr:hypothetical protein [Bacteroidia bacterium]